MRRCVSFIAIATLVLLAGVGGRPEEALSRPAGQGPEPSAPSGADGGPSFAPDRILVKTKAGASTEAVEPINRKNRARTEKKLDRIKVSVVKLPKDLSPAEAIESYESSPDVEYAEPDYELYSTQSSPAPNDPSYSMLYGLNNTGQDGGTADADVDAPEAWRAAPDDAGTVVAVIDTGTDTNHPDLKNNIWVNPDEVAGNGVDDDKNGYVDDVNGWDFANENASVFDAPGEDKHGTHVAGTIAAEGNNGLGVIGVNWRAKVMPLKFIGSSGSGYTSDAAAALDYAVAEGAKISNNSYGCAGCFSQTLLYAIKAADSKGHLFVAAAGNDGANTDATPHYPAGYDSANIVSVAATDNQDALSSTSNYGANSVDLAAPGRYVYSTLPGNTYGWYSGTSMAAPHVAGVAAMLKSYSPGSDDAQLKARLLKSVDKKTGLDDKMVSGGRLNAAEALAANAAPAISEPLPGSGSRTGDRTPTISAVVRDDQTDLTKSNVNLYIDGRSVTAFAYDETTDRLAYTGNTRLSRGRHTVQVVAWDAQGERATYTWKFSIR